MFYSHTFLARKGPLGTVWCAAHLQHRLRKPQYIATDISSTVDRILFPEVPIALRLSGHLLLGVVRIYSKKVDYLYHDCEIVLFGVKKSFPSSEPNLPKVSRCARIQDVTVPDTLDLENLNFDNELRNEGGLDVNMRSEDEITLPDQIPVEIDPFVTRSFNEDAWGSDQIQLPTTAPMENENSTIQEAGHLGPTTMEKVILTNPLDQLQGPIPMEEDNSVILMDRNLTTIQDEETTTPGRASREINEMETNNDLHIEKDVVHIERPLEINEGGKNNDLNIKSIDASLERCRGPSHDNILENFSELLSAGIHLTMNAGSGEQSNSGKDTHSHPTECIKNSREMAQPSHERQLLLSVEKSDTFNMNNSAPPSIKLEILASPPQNRRRQKRKFDQKTVLSNGYIQSAIDDPSDICRVKRMCPSSALDAWKLKNILGKEDAFYGIQTTGACMDLQNLFKKDFILSKSRSVVLEEGSSDDSAHVLGFDENVAQQNLHQTLFDPVSDVAPSTDNRFVAPELPSHIQEGVTQEKITIEDCRGMANIPESNLPAAPCDDIEFAAAHPNSPIYSSEHIRENVESAAVYHMENFTPINIFSPHHEHSPGRSTIEPNLNSSFLEEHRTEVNIDSSANLNFDKSAGTDDELNFLEADSHSISGCGLSQEIHSLSARTRAAARYLIGLSPRTPDKQIPLEHNLTEILEGKTRKLCARMFFETLVLKSFQLVDVQQSEAFGDIKLRITPMLSSGQF